jgi:predicted nucleotidyltransferase
MRAKVKPITVRLDADDHRALVDQAERLGVGVGTLSRMLIRGGLRGAGSIGEIGGGREGAKGVTARMSEEILRVAARRGARNVRVFGSRARGEAGAESDVDLLVEMEPGRSLLDLVGLSQDLEELLGRPVDVVTEASLSPHLRGRVQEEAVPL